MAADAMGPDSAALVFVYGSLKRGECNHNQLAGCRWLGSGELPGLALYDLGPFPMAVTSDAAGAHLQGELYAVTAAQLAALDRFEGTPRLYERQAHRLTDGRLVWVYVGRPRQVRHVRRLSSGQWSGGERALVLLVLLPMWPLLGVSLRQDCLTWQRSHGSAQVAISDRIGREQLLTRAHQPADVKPDGSQSLYSWADIQRLCRRQ